MPQKARRKSQSSIGRVSNLSTLLRESDKTKKVILVKSDLLNDYLRLDVDQKSGILCDSLKLKLLKYLRIPRDTCHQYYLSKFGFVDKVGARREVIIEDSEIIEGASLSPPGHGGPTSPVEPLILRLCRLKTDSDTRSYI